MTSDTSVALQNFVLTYFPYLNMGGIEEIDFGFAKIWNFDKKKEAYISDAAVRTQIDKILATHVSHFRPVTGIGIFSCGSVDFHEPAEEDQKSMRLVRLISFICFLARNNTVRPGPNAGHSMATSENFDVILQRMVVGSDDIAENTGAIVQFLIGGYRLDRTTFQRPSFVPTPSPFAVDAELFSGLLELRTKSPRIFERVINAVEIFYESYYNSPSVSRSARILLQASAFEILLDLPEQNQRKAFKEAIKSLTCLSGEPLLTYFSERNGKKVKDRGSLKEIWADKFYTLRNHIIHGHTPANREFIFRNAQMHFDIALFFFVFCIKKRIEKSLPSRIPDCEIRWKTWEDDLVIPPQRRSGFEYSISWERILRRKLAQSAQV